MSIALKDLQTQEGASALSSALGDDQKSVARIRALIQRELSKRPDLSKIQVSAGGEAGNASYNFERDTLQTGSMNPDVMGHEIGHAKNLHSAPVYQKLLLVSKGLTALNRSAAPAVMLGLHAFVENPEERNDLLSSLSGMSAAAAAPGLVEEASASADAIMGSDDKLRAVKKLLPALGLHAVNDLLPVLLYQLNKYL